MVQKISRGLRCTITLNKNLLTICFYKLGEFRIAFNLISECGVYTELEQLADVQFKKKKQLAQQEKKQFFITKQLCYRYNRFNWRIKFVNGQKKDKEEIEHGEK